MSHHTSSSRDLLFCRIKALQKSFNQTFEKKTDLQRNTKNAAFACPISIPVFSSFQRFHPSFLQFDLSSLVLYLNEFPLQILKVCKFTTKAQKDVAPQICSICLSQLCLPSIIKRTKTCSSNTLQEFARDHNPHNLINVTC